jgi:hypothetical protein
MALAICTHLEQLDLRKNGLTGEFSRYLTFFHDLRILSLDYNNLHGFIPPYITNLTKLHVLDLSNNKFNGSIPVHFERLSKFANVSNKYDTDEEIEIDMKGSEYNLLYLLPKNTIFDLSCNNLT